MVRPVDVTRYCNTVADQCISAARRQQHSSKNATLGFPSPTKHPGSAPHTRQETMDSVWPNKPRKHGGTIPSSN
jgi:hypothetical protein